MDSFGLGLILSFTDNATAGINSAVNSLQQLTNTASSASAELNQMASLTAFSSIASEMGSTMTSAGAAIISTFGQVISKVNETGQTLMYAESQLNKLYEGSSRTGKDVLNDISQYAKTSIFEFEQLIPSVIMLKANGIEAFDAITSSSGKSSQMLMDYAADLAAFNPQMRNAYGTGIQAAMGALNEYISEGNTLSLKRGASLDILGLLGEEKGATMEDRARQVADLMEQLNMVGMTASLAQSPMTKLSNMSDTLFQFLGMVSNSGVYDQFNSIISVFADFVNNIPEERLQSIAATVGSALSAIMKPIEMVAKRVVQLADAFLILLENNPGLAKTVTIITALVGVLLLFGGIALKVAGSLGYLTLMLKSLSTSFSSIGTIMKTGALKIMGALIPLTLALGAMYLTWKHDLFGIRTTVTTFSTGVSNSFKTAKSAIGGSLEDMRNILSTFDTQNNFFDGLTIAIMKLMVVGRALVEGWNTFQLSDDTFLRAQELGILPLIEALFNFKFRFDNFKDGFIEGLNIVSERVKSFFGFLSQAFKGTIFDTLFDKITGLFQALTNNDPATWKNFGRVVGEVAASFILVAGALKVLNTVLRPFTRTGGILPTVLGGGGRGGSSGGASGGGLLSNPAKVLKTMGSLAIIIGGSALVITALGGLMNNPYLNTFLQQGVTILPALFKGILPLAGGVAVLSVLFAAMNMLKLNPKTALTGIGNLAIILLGFEVIITAMGALASIPGFADFISTGATTALSLMGTLEAMFNLKALAVMGLIAAFGLIPVTVVAMGLANFAIILGGMTLLISAFAALQMIPGFNDFIVSGGDTIALLFEQIGKIAGSVVGGFGIGVTNALPEIANNLAGFGENLQPFFSALSGAPLSEIGEFATQMGAFFLMLGGQQLLSFFTGDLDLVGIGQQLGDFGVAAAPFFSSVAAYPEAGLEKAPRVFEGIVGIGQYSFKTGGIAQFFTGETSLSVIGEQLASFAPNGATFFNAVAGYSESGLEKAPKVFESIAGIGQYSFKTGGVAQFFTGETSLTVIGEQLATFAPNGTTFFNTVGGYSEAGLTKAPRVFEALAGIGDYDFKTGGIAQLFTGTTSLEHIGNELTKFGNAAKGFFDTAAQISQTGLDNGLAVMQALSNISAFKTGGLVELFAGSIDLVGIGNQLTEFSGNVKGFFDTAATISYTGIARGQQIFEVLGSVGDFAFRSGGFAQLFTGEVNLTRIGTDLTTFATNVKGFFITASTISSTAFTNAPRMFNSIKGAGDLVDVATKSGGNLSRFGRELVSFADSLTIFFEKAGAMGDTSGIGTMTGAIETLSTSFTNTQGNISSSSSAIVTALQDLSTSFNTTSTTTVMSLSDMGTAVTAFDTTFLTVTNNVNTTATTLKTSISTLVSAVVVDLQRLSAAFANTKLEFSQTHIKVPHFTMSGKFNAELGTVPKINVNWYKQGGVFSEPSIIGLAEAGREAVVPLENNTEWIGMLANEINSNMTEDARLHPVSTVTTNNQTSNTSDGDETYFTTTQGSSHYDQSETDNSVTFESGSIIVQVMSASEEEAERFAELVMRKIKRKRELEAMMSYATI